MGRYRGAHALRREISARNLARMEQFPAETTFGSTPSVIYAADASGHGNFLPASYRAIQANSDWRRRLGKAYCASRQVPRAHDRARYELDCANSSDALLMNIFCHPRLLARPQLCALLGVPGGLRPAFGIRQGVPLATGRCDRSEFDMALGDLLVEAKLTESNFQRAPDRLVRRYRDLETVFDVDRLPLQQGSFLSYQLIRGALAAFARGGSFLLLCDHRQPGLIRQWFTILQAVQGAEMRSRMKLATWQELAATLPRSLQRFLEEKYGIVSA